MKFRKLFLPVSLVFMVSGPAFSQMMILSGPEKGSYNRFVNDISKVLGEKEGLKIINKSTGGSAYNFKVLINPSSNDKMILIQSDYFNLMKGEDKLKNTNKTGSLKVVMQLATEEIHLVARKSSGLTKLQDLSMKKVGIGNDDQGSLATARMIKERSKVGYYTYNVGFDQMAKKLSDRSIDAALIVGSAPVNVLEIDPQVMIDGIALLELDDINGWAKQYENDTIYKGTYPWLDKNVPTFGVRTLLVVNESKLTDEDRKTVDAIKSGIVRNLDQLRAQGHPGWKSVIIPDDPGAALNLDPAPAVAASAVTIDTKDEVKFRVQVYSRNYKQKEDQITINGNAYKTYVYSHLGAYRYAIGEFPSASSAMELQKICRDAGYTDAFVAAFKNNVRSNDPALFK